MEQYLSDRNQLYIFDNNNFSIIPKSIFSDNDNLPISCKNANLSAVDNFFDNIAHPYALVHYALVHDALVQYACAAHGLRCRCRPCVHCPTRCFLLSLTKQQLELLPLQRCGKDRKPCQCPYSCHTLATTKVIPPDPDK